MSEYQVKVGLQPIDGQPEDALIGEGEIAIGVTGSQGVGMTTTLSWDHFMHLIDDHFTVPVDEQEELKDSALFILDDGTNPDTTSLEVRKVLHKAAIILAWFHDDQTIRGEIRSDLRRRYGDEGRARLHLIFTSDGIEFLVGGEQPFNLSNVAPVAH